MSTPESGSVSSETSHGGNELTIQERHRVLELLIEVITFHPDSGEVEIEFRPGGIRTLAREETA